MFARPRPAPFAVSLLTHGLILAWVASGPVREEPKSLYAQAIAPHASKLVWYNFREKLPDVSPTAARRPATPPRADAKTASQEIVAATAEARRARQFVWQPAPKLELHTDLQSPNVLAIRAPRAKPPPPRCGAPPSGRAVNKPAPALPDAPVLAAAAKPAMAAPPILGRGVAKPSPFGSPLPAPPALPESASASAVSMAIVGLNPSANAPAPAPEGSRNAQFSAAAQPRRTGGTDGSVDDAILTVPGLFIRSGVPDAKPAPMARASPTSAANLHGLHQLHAGRLHHRIARLD